MFTSRNIHFAILGIILGAATGYIMAFYQAAAAAPPVDPPHAAAATDPQGALPANHPDVNSPQMLDLLKKAAEDSPNQPEVLSRYANELFQIGKMENPQCGTARLSHCNRRTPMCEASTAPCYGESAGRMRPGLSFKPHRHRIEARAEPARIVYHRPRQP
jgi:hypothetical protein